MINQEANRIFQQQQQPQQQQQQQQQRNMMQNTQQQRMQQQQPNLSQRMPSSVISHMQQNSVISQRQPQHGQIYQGQMQGQMQSQMQNFQGQSMQHRYPPMPNNQGGSSLQTQMLSSRQRSPPQHQQPIQSMYSTRTPQQPQQQPQQQQQQSQQYNQYPASYLSSMSNSQSNTSGASGGSAGGGYHSYGVPQNYGGPTSGSPYTSYPSGNAMPTSYPSTSNIPFRPEQQQQQQRMNVPNPSHNLPSARKLSLLTVF